MVCDSDIQWNLQWWMLQSKDSLSTNDTPFGPKIFSPYIFSIHLGLPNEGQPSYKGQNNCPKVSFIWRFHCIVTCVTSMIVFIE